MDFSAQIKRQKAADRKFINDHNSFNSDLCQADSNPINGQHNVKRIRVVCQKYTLFSPLVPTTAIIPEILFRFVSVNNFLKNTARKTGILNVLAYI